MLAAPGWREVPGLVHGFLGRRGGVSTGPFSSLNLGDRVGDDPLSVARNWSEVRSAFAALRIVRMEQVHGANVVRVEDEDGEIGPADALTTDRPGFGLAILTADCVPLLLVAPASRVVVAVHAGWRGTLAGVAAEALAAACRYFAVRPSGFWAALGPAIGACCYEVEAAIGRELEERWGAMPDAWRPGGERGMLDLRRANRRILARSGVLPGCIVDVGGCTACHPDDFFSHRGSGGTTGRQLSLIGWQRSRRAGSR